MILKGFVLYIAVFLGVHPYEYRVFTDEQKACKLVAENLGKEGDLAIFSIPIGQKYGTLAKATCTFKKDGRYKIERCKIGSICVGYRHE